MAERGSADHDALEAERDFLLRSLDDLDAELAAGEVGEEQYAELRARYVGRAASVARRLEGGDERDVDAPAAAVPRAVPRRRGRILAFAVLLAVGAGAGVLLAANLGQRSGGRSATGTAGPEDRAATCRGLVFTDPPAARTCYDRLLATSPDDAEYLTYRGWAAVRAGDAAAATDDFDRVVEVDPEYPDVYAFRAVVAKDRGDFVAAQAELDRLRELDPPATVLDTVSSMGLDVEIAEGLLRPEVRTCWTSEKAAITAINRAVGGQAAAGDDLSASLTSLIDADRCLSAALEAVPDDATALVMRGLAISVLYQVSLAAEPDAAVLQRAVQVLDRAVELDPTDADARLVRAAVRNMAGDPKAAAEDLDAIGDRTISPLFATIDIEAIRSDVQRQLDS